MTASQQSRRDSELGLRPGTSAMLGARGFQVYREEDNDGAPVYAIAMDDPSRVFRGQNAGNFGNDYSIARIVYEPRDVERFASLVAARPSAIVPRTAKAQDALRAARAARGDDHIARTYTRKGFASAHDELAGIEVTKPTAATPKSATPKAAAHVRVDSQLRLLNNPTDPQEAWERFGASRASLHAVLLEEPTGVLEVMARRAGGLPAGYDRLKSDGAQRRALAKSISAQMATRNGKTAAPAAKKPRASAAGSAAKTKAKAKTTAGATRQARAAGTSARTTRSQAAPRTPLATSPRLRGIRAQQTAWRERYAAATARGLSPMQAADVAGAYPDARALP